MLYLQSLCYCFLSCQLFLDVSNKSVPSPELSGFSCSCLLFFSKLLETKRLPSFTFCTSPLYVSVLVRPLNREPEDQKAPPGLLLIDLVTLQGSPCFGHPLSHGLCHWSQDWLESCDCSSFRASGLGPCLSSILLPSLAPWTFAHRNTPPSTCFKCVLEG